MLTSNQFKVLVALAEKPGQTQRGLADSTGLSLGTVSATMGSLRNAEAEAIDAAGRLTEVGRKLLEPYRVRNAVIMAAGLSSRFAPISYEKPKGLLNVRGEVLVERQIRQLREAGIQDIYLVLGYKKEEFFYLEDAFGVHIRINEEYAVRNNNSTIRCVEDVLDNTYICSSDDYFASNPFEPYVYQSYYSAVFEEGQTPEYCLNLEGRDDKIRAVVVGGADAWVMLGHVYWDRSFSQRFVEILDREYDRPETAPKLWEDIYIEHLSELPMVARKYDAEDIWEFDSLDEVSVFDPGFIQNVDSSILDNICRVLDCGRSAIHDIVPLKQGQTNLSFRFTVGDSRYVYRHPGEGTEEIINRESEAFSEAVAARLELDETFVFEDPAEGWKLSHFLDGAHTLDYRNQDEVDGALTMIRRLHTADVQSPWTFDLFDEAQRIVRKLDEADYTSFRDFADLAELAKGMSAMVLGDDVAPCLCHNAFYDENVLVCDGGMSIIDWEYSGMGDYGSDLGTFICCGTCDRDAAPELFESYFGRALAVKELRHCLACVALAAYYWFVWGLYAESRGREVGEWLYRWYRAVKDFSAKAYEVSALM